MPLYEYECDACGKRFEVIQQRYSDAPPETCRRCGKGPVRRLASSPAIQFKGSGFYITDYAKKSSSEASSGKSSSEKSSGDKSGSDSKGGDSGSTSSSSAPASPSTSSSTDSGSSSGSSSSDKKS